MAEGGATAIVVTKEHVILPEADDIVMYCGSRESDRPKSLVRKLVRRAARVQQRSSAVGVRVNPKVGGETG